MVTKFRILIIILVAMVFTGCKKEKEDFAVPAGGFKKRDIIEFKENAVKLIGKDWMLITAGSPDKFNTMTASWGCLGYLWEKPVAVVFIRPQRYTFEFVEENSLVTLSFFAEPYRKQLSLLGTKSGRDSDKIKESGLTPTETPEGGMAFKEARIIIEGKKLYADFLNPEAFVDDTIDEGVYPQKDYHKMYILEIENIYEK